MKKGIIPEELYTLEALEEITGLKVRTLRLAIKEGKLSAYKAYGRYFVYGSDFQESVKSSGEFFKSKK